MRVQIFRLALIAAIGAWGCDQRSDGQGESDAGGREAVTADPIPSAGCGAGAPAEDGPFSVVVEETEHKYLIDFPDGYDENRPYPLLFAFHFAGGNAPAAKSMYGLGAVVGKDGIIVYPNGHELPVFDAILEAVQSSYCIDVGRIFATGLSLGGGMSNTVGCERGDVLRAVAPVAGTGPIASAVCTGRVAVMQIHGVRDPIAAIAASLPGRDRWLTMSECDPEASQAAFAKFTDTCQRYEGCDKSFPVIWCQHNDPFGHVWPAFASKAIWAFFSGLSSLPQGEEAGPGAAMDPSEISTIKLSVRAPDDFKGTPRSVAFSLYPAGTRQPVMLPPTLILAENIDPGGLAPGVTVEFEADIAGFQSLGKLPRDLTLMVTVYMVGGGTMIPASGTDYLALQKVTIESETQDIVVEETLDLVPVIGIF